MTLFLLMASPLSVDADWTFEESAIYKNLSKRDVAVNEYGETFILDAAECQIVKLNSDGSFALRFGKKGQGPGEFSFPGDLQTFGDHIYLVDMMSSNLICFNREGTFVEQWKIGRFQDLNRIKDGWVCGTWSHSPAGVKQGGLKKVDMDWGPESMIFDFSKGKKEETPEGISIQIVDGYAAMTHNPAPHTPHLGVTPDGKYLALVHPGSQLKVDIYDTATQKIVKTLSERAQPLAFNKNWGEELIKKMNKATEDQSAQGNIKVKFSADFPDFFPYVREFTAHGDGRFYVLPWSAKPDAPATLFSFDEKGVKEVSDITTVISNRILHLTKTHGWVGTFEEEEEEAGLAKVPRAQLAAFIKANPIAKTSSASSVMMIGN